MAKEPLIIPPDEHCDGHTLTELRRIARKASLERQRMEEAKRNHLDEPFPQFDWLNRGGIGHHQDAWVGLGDRWALALCDSHVMKIDKRENLHQQNRKEIAIWENADPLFAENLAPIFAYGLPAGARSATSSAPWLVMGRCQMEPDYEKGKPFMDRVYGYGYVGLDNIGWYQGKLVLLDFANPESTEFGVNPPSPPTTSQRTL